MLRRLSLLAILAVIGASCGSSDGAQRTVLVDFSSDEFASSAFLNVPDKVTVKPGTTIVFRQTWTGEPHTVTSGTLVNDVLAKGRLWLNFFNSFDALIAAGAPLPDPESPGDATWPDVARTLRTKGPRAERERVVMAYNALIRSGVELPSLDNPPDMRFDEVGRLVETLSEEAFEGLLFAFGEDDGLAQNVAQPCYLRHGGPPEESAESCREADQRQPMFDGKHSFYNSGIIPYEGGNGNTFKVQLADDIEPGSYLFYCAVHGPGQLTEVEVRPADARVPSSGDVVRDTRREVGRVNEPLERIYRTAVEKGEFATDDETVRGPFAGLVNPRQDHALINEFIPRTLRAKAGEPITWKLFGSDHTISFDVPRYFPIIEFRDEGVRLNPRLGEPQGGAPPIPEQEEEGVLRVDGGTYDGEGFWSTGLVGGSPYAEYTVRIGKPGTYDYACLIHPPMVGKLVIT